jgi:hypothetical protein
MRFWGGGLKKYEWPERFLSAYGGFEGRWSFIGRGDLCVGRGNGKVGAEWDDFGKENREGVRSGRS